MKKVTSRAWASLLIAAALLLGMAVYVLRFARDGQDWVFFRANQNIYQDGLIVSGTVTDRDGVTLAHSGEEGHSYAEDELTRRSCLHALGDFSGNIGTGALSVYSGELSGYSVIGGVSGGGSIALTISSELSRAAYEALAGRSGAVLMSNYATGEMLCMVSTPSFDPLRGFDEDDPAYAGAYINRCLSAAYTPGSVFKLVTLAAAIENIDDLYERTFTCTGSSVVDGMVIKCSGVHGQQTVEQALANSCNCAFAELSLELGGETIADYAEKFGFTSALDFDGIATAAGRVDAFPDGSTDLAWSGIGQATDLISPYAMLRYVSAVAAGGQVREPRLHLDGKSGVTRLLSEDTAQRIGEMMSYNVAYGYGGSAAFGGLKLCAKSGTAEVGDGSSHAWFTGYLDDPEHPYAFTVVIEHGGGGLRNAGAVANTLLQKAVTLDLTGDEK